MRIMARSNRYLGVERRLSRRYPADSALEYRLVRGRDIIQTGGGQTLNISDSGVLFESEHPLAPGLDIELSIRWPSGALRLCAIGRTVRAEQNRCAVSIMHYDFHDAAVLPDPGG